MKDVTFPIRVLMLGIESLIVTMPLMSKYDFTPGDLMIIKDHINFTGQTH